MNKDLAPGALVKPKRTVKQKQRNTIKLRNRRRRAAEAPVIAKVRAACVERDDWCRVSEIRLGIVAERAPGPSEWAHMHSHRRSKTRGLPPEERHTTAASLMLCKKHHDAYDGRTLPKLEIVALTDKGADGPLQFTYKGRSYSEEGEK